jgi:NAD-reducing hydrogenase small subunit
MSKTRIATVWLDGCSGCHMSLLDLDEALLTLARRIELVYGPLVDAYEFPEDVDVTLVEGAVSSQEDLRLVQKIRQRTRLLAALGDCAVTANVPSMRNTFPPGRILERVYLDGAGAWPRIPSEGVPALLRQAVPVQEVVKVDLHIPGCPPKPDVIGYALTELLDGRKPGLAGKVKFG